METVRAMGGPSAYLPTSAVVRSSRSSSCRLGDFQVPRTLGYR